MPEMFDFSDELEAREAVSTAMRYVAEKLGIVLLASKKNDECAGVWLYKMEQDDGSYKVKQVSSRSHSAQGVVYGVLDAIESIGTWEKKSIKLIGYLEAKRLVEERLE